MTKAKRSHLIAGLGKLTMTSKSGRIVLLDVRLIEVQKSFDQRQIEILEQKLILMGLNRFWLDQLRENTNSKSNYSYIKEMETWIGKLSHAEVYSNSILITGEVEQCDMLKAGVCVGDVTESSLATGQNHDINQQMFTIQRKAVRHLKPNQQTYGILARRTFSQMAGKQQRKNKK